MQEAFRRGEKYEPDILHLSFILSLALSFQRNKTGNFHHFSEKYYNLQDNFEFFLSWKCIFSLFFYMQTWIPCQWRQWKCCSYKTKLYFSTWILVTSVHEWHSFQGSGIILFLTQVELTVHLCHSRHLTNVTVSFSYFMWFNCYSHWTPLICQTQNLVVHLVEKKTSNWHMSMSWTWLSIIHLTELAC